MPMIGGGMRAIRDTLRRLATMRELATDRRRLQLAWLGPCLPDLGAKCSSCPDFPAYVELCIGGGNQSNDLVGDVKNHRLPATRHSREEAR